jgi:hypothetical protein
MKKRETFSAEEMKVGNCLVGLGIKCKQGTSLVAVRELMMELTTDHHLIKEIKLIIKHS